MRTKSGLKKKLILERSRDLFAKEGYQAVTMTAIVEACGISRGGLYKYYKNTHEIFLEILGMEQERVGKDFSDSMKNGMSGVGTLDSFFRQQKEELLNKESTMAVAIYEFFFINRNRIEQNILKEQFDSAVRILSDLIQYGMDKGEFKRVDKRAAAGALVLLIEGIRVSSQVMEIPEELVDQQFSFFRSLLVNEKRQGH